MQAEIHLPYFKQGCDMQTAIDQAHGDTAEGLEVFADHLVSMAKYIRELKEALGERSREVTISGDTHCIFVEGPEDLLSSLIEKDLLQESEDFEEDDEDDEDDEEYELI